MAEYKFKIQDDLGFVQSFNMGVKAPAIANRVFDTYENALDFINDVDSSAIPGIILNVFDDTEDVNGAYFVKKIASAAGLNDGVLEKIGSEKSFVSVENYSAGVEIATNDNRGQVIYIENDETIDDTTYAQGPYIVTGAGNISPLSVSIAGETDLTSVVATLQGKVSSNESNITSNSDSISAIETEIGEAPEADKTVWSAITEVNSALEWQGDDSE